nr:unnamed protein product [Digitaria exilis]
MVSYVSRSHSTRVPVPPPGHGGGGVGGVEGAGVGRRWRGAEGAGGEVSKEPAASRETAATARRRESRWW